MRFDESMRAILESGGIEGQIDCVICGKGIPIYAYTHHEPFPICEECLVFLRQLKERDTR